MKFQPYKNWHIDLVYLKIPLECCLTGMHSIKMPSWATPAAAEHGWQHLEKGIALTCHTLSMVSFSIIIFATSSITRQQARTTQRRHTSMQKTGRRIDERRHITSWRYWAPRWFESWIRRHFQHAGLCWLLGCKMITLRKKRDIADFSAFIPGSLWYFIVDSLPLDARFHHVMTRHIMPL